MSAVATISAERAAQNAYEVLRHYHRDGAFDHRGYLDEMQVRCLTVHGRLLRRSEQRTLAEMVKAYLSKVNP